MVATTVSAAALTGLLLMSRVGMEIIADSGTRIAQTNIPSIGMSSQRSSCGLTLNGLGQSRHGSGLSCSAFGQCLQYILNLFVVEIGSCFYVGLFLSLALSYSSMILRRISLMRSTQT